MCGADNMEGFLTLAERQYIVKYELDGLRAQRDMKIPGLPDSFTLKSRENVCEYSSDFYSGLRAHDKHTGQTPTDTNNSIIHYLHSGEKINNTSLFLSKLNISL